MTCINAQIWKTLLSPQSQNILIEKKLTLIWAMFWNCNKIIERDV